ncbi:MAG: hypothetical protein ABI887_12460 [Burkholderiales bacterium]
MSISVTGAGRISARSPDTPAPGTNVASAITAASESGLTTTHDDGLQTPTPPRFPWLSRLSAQLEPTARQKPAFPSAPQLGDNLDQAA